MSPPENKLDGKIISIVLCAGEGKRISKFIPQIPKPLIEINNKPLLSHLISNLIDFNITSIYIITGHRREEIEDYVSSLIENDVSLKNKVTIINSGNDYKKGPLYSFLSITKNRKIIKKGLTYLIFPGDTYFESDLLGSILNFLHDHLALTERDSIVFYQKINGKQLKGIQDPNTLISTLEFEEGMPDMRIKQIWQKKLSSIASQEHINRLIPLFVFSSSFINKIANIERKLSVETIREITNYLIKEDSILTAYQINAQFRFYDIDTELDLLRLKGEKK
ncbi:MAG: NTP transferase domain-containing protein [Promethearchaeota archaeon]